MTLFSTFTHPFFTELHKDWYIQQDGKYIKALPGNMNELLTPRAIAYWISGDRSIKTKIYSNLNGVFLPGGGLHSTLRSP
jgi:hypothetical protein